MFKRSKAALCLAACAVFGGATVHAAEPSSFTSQPLKLEAEAPASQSFLNQGLDTIGMGAMMKNYGIKAGAYVEGSYSYNFADPDDNLNAGRVFDFEHDAPRLNQVALQIARTPDIAAAAKAGKFDIGFGIDMMYGNDGRLIHSNGLQGYNRFRSPINQYDLTQAYLDFIIPVGNGLDIRAGKFVTPFGQETIAPIATVTGSSGNQFFSHSFQFGFGIPFTHTGVIASYNLNDKLTLTGGITRGWEQSTKDNNGAIDFLGQVKYAMSDEWTMLFNASVGPQKFRNNSDYRYLFEGIAQYSPKSSKWAFAADGIFGWEEHSAANGDVAYWYGLTGYAGYKVSDMVTVNGRAEWFRDDSGSRTGINASFYEVTIGAKVTPFPHDKILSNLILRPEVRGDFSNKDAFNGGTDRNQGTVAIDAIFAL